MKANYFFLTLASIMLLQGGLHAQGVVVQEPHLVVSEKTIIREQIYPATVTCANLEDNTACFIMYNPPMMTEEVYISGFTINDMAVTEDSVFFCGVKNKKGFVGYFNIQDVFFGSGSITIQEDLKAGTKAEPIAVLNRLDIYQEAGGKRHLFCVGKTESGFPCIIDNYNFQTGAYRSGHIEHTSETFTDVKVVQDSTGGDYLVTTGFETTYGQYINIRIFQPNNIFSPSGIQDQSYLIYSDPSGTRSWIENEVLLTPVKQDLFATVSYRKNPSATLSSWEATNIHVAYFRLSRFMLGNLAVMDGNIETPVNFGQTSRSLHDIASKNDGQSIAFIHTTTTGVYGNLSDEFFEVGYSSGSSPSWTLQRYSYNGSILQSLDAYNNASQYVMSGSGGFSSTVLMYETETFGISETCASLLKSQFEVVPTVNAVRSQDNFIFGDYVATKAYPVHENKGFTLFIDCNSEE